MALTVSLCRVSQLRHDTRETCLAMLKRPAIYSFLQWRCVSPETSAAGVAGGTQAEGFCVLGVLIKYCPPPPTPPPPSLSACVSGEAATRHTGPRWWARVATGTTGKGRRAYRDFFCLNFFVQASRWGRLWVLLIHPREVVQQSNGSVKEEKRYIWSGVQ